MLRSRLALGALLLGGVLGACGPARPPAVRPYSERPDLRGLDLEPLRGRRILIDPGHGGGFAGAVGDAATREADINLGVALDLWGLLHDAGADVHLTRSSDRDLLGGRSGSAREDLSARVHAIDSLQPDVFLSLHHNSNAARDRERNAIETYFKLDDEGPSLDLGSAIATRLARHLDIVPATLVPGNYFVLRGAKGPAVLGEASYLSNPGIESQLRLADSQRLEAEAYFLGLLDYFARGAAAVVRVAPPGDTLGVGAPVRFEVAEAIDPLAVEVEVDGAPAPAVVLPLQGAIRLAGELAPGPHAVRVRARLARGNAAQPWRGSLVVRARPAQAVLSQEPVVARLGSAVRVRVAIQDASGASIGSHLPVALQETGIEILAAEPWTTEGTVIALVRARSSPAVLGVEAGGFAARLPLALGPQGEAARFVRCVDARDGHPVPYVASDDGSLVGDRLGIFALASHADSLRASAAGYLPWSGRVPADSILRFVPVYGGALQGVSIAVDPAGSGSDVQLVDGLFASRESFAVCRALRELVLGGGGRCALTRAATEAPSDLQRLERALESDPAWFVGVECGRGPGFVAHDPGSTSGARLAAELSGWLARRLGGSFTVREETRFLLRQTPCPAVIVHLPSDALRTPGGDRRAAYALFLGLRSGTTAAPLPRTVLAGRVPADQRADLVELDGAAVLPVGREGRFAFEALEPGVHEVRILGNRPLERRVVVPSGVDSVAVQLVSSRP